MRGGAPYRQSVTDSKRVVLPAPFMPPTSTTGLPSAGSRSNSQVPAYAP